MGKGERSSAETHAHNISGRQKEDRGGTKGEVGEVQSGEEIDRNDGRESTGDYVRIVVWNCRMGFSKKRDVLYAPKPDLAVIPECSQDAARLCNEDGYSTCWWGGKKHKGLAMLAAKPWTVEVGR